MSSQINHDMALAYASSKLTEYEIDKREAPLCGNISMSQDEIQYMKKAYEFAIQHLSEDN